MTAARPLARPAALGAPPGHPPPVNPGGAPPMPVAYAPGRVILVSDSRLSVLFERRDTADDGSAGPAQRLDPASGAWVNEPDAAHSRRLDADAGNPRIQSFAVPVKVTDDPTACAFVHLDGDPKAVQLVYTANELYAHTRAPSAKS